MTTSMTNSMISKRRLVLPIGANKKMKHAEVVEPASGNENETEKTTQSEETPEE